MERCGIWNTWKKDSKNNHQIKQKYGPKFSPLCNPPHNNLPTFSPLFIKFIHIDSEVGIERWLKLFILLKKSSKNFLPIQVVSLLHYGHIYFADKNLFMFLSHLPFWCGISIEIKEMGFQLPQKRFFVFRGKTFYAFFELFVRNRSLIVIIM